MIAPMKPWIKQILIYAFGLAVLFGGQGVRSDEVMSRLAKDAAELHGLASYVGLQAELCPRFLSSNEKLDRPYIKWEKRNHAIVTKALAILVKGYLEIGGDETAREAEVAFESDLQKTVEEMKEILSKEMQRDQTNWTKSCRKFPDLLEAGAYDLEFMFPEIVLRIMK